MKHRFYGCVNRNGLASENWANQKNWHQHSILNGLHFKKKQNWIHNLNAIYNSLVPHSGPFSPFSHLHKIVWDSWCLRRDVSAGPWNSKYGGGPTLPRSLFLLSVRSNADPSLSHTERWGFRRRGWSSLQSQGLMCSLLRRIAIFPFLTSFIILLFCCSHHPTVSEIYSYRS